MAGIVVRISAAVAFSFVVAATGVISGCGGSKTESHTAASESGGDQLPVGSPAPDLSIQTINGKGKISNESLKGKIAIVDFWATWCAPCKTSFPKLEELSKKHAGRVEIIGVAVDGEKGEVASFAKETGATFAIGLDDEAKTIAARWKVKAMPTTVILDASGNVRHVHAGFHDDEPEKIANELTALLAEPAPAASPKTEVASASAPHEESKKEEAKKEEEEEAPAVPPNPKKPGKTKPPTKKAGGKPKKKH